MIGTFNCPICGYDKPHGHESVVVAAYHDDQVRNDGWTSVIVSRPKKRGLYLCRGHKLIAPKANEDFYNVGYNGYQRIHENGGYEAEVLEFSNDGHFCLLHYSGNALPSGEEGRHPVYVEPSHWMVLPPFGVSNDPAAVAKRMRGLEAVLDHINQQFQSFRFDSEHEQRRLIQQLAELSPDK